MDRDAGHHDRADEAEQGDTGMIGSETEEPGPGRDTSLTEPDPAAAGSEQPRGTVAMSEGDPMRTRLGSHVEGAGQIGYDVVAAEEGATQQTPAEDRPAYEHERLPGESAAAATAAPAYGDPDPAGYGAGAATAGYEGEPGGAGATEYERAPGAAGYEGEPGGAGMAGYQEPGREAPASYTGEEADVTGRPEYADRTEGGEQPLYQQEPQRADRPGGGGSLFTDEEPERLDRPGPQEPGVDQGIYDQEADQARRERPTDGS